MSRAIIFDFDGTLANTIPAITEGVNLTLAAHGFPTHTEAEMQTYINNGPRMLIRRALPAEHQADEALLDRILADYNELYQTVCLHTDRCYDGMAELVDTLRARGFRIGVLSNKQDHLLRILCDGVLPSKCDAILGTVPNKPTKPDPSMTTAIAAVLGVAPQDCILVGDSDVDILTAKNAGMPHVGVAWGYRNEAFLRENGASHVAHTPEELLNIIESIESERTSSHD